MRVPRALARLTTDGDWVPGAGGAGEVSIWPYTQHWAYPWRTGNPGRADPVNLFVIGLPFADVLTALAPEGWSRPEGGQTHSLWIGGRRRRMDDHITAGTRERRFHTRLWSLGGGTLMAAHDEYLNSGGRHVVTSWDAARERLVADLVAAGFRSLAPSVPVAPANLRGVPGDGRIWRLTAA